MKTQEILTALGYTDSPFYRPLNATDNYFYRDSVRNFTKLSILGTYYYSTSEDNLTTPKVALQIAEAKTSEEARAIHKKIWNHGLTPFLIISLPNEIRVYNGFDYSEKQEHTLISKVALNEVREKLSLFHSNRIDSGEIWQGYADQINPNTRVDKQLLKNLEELGHQLKNHYGLEPHIANSLIGKYLYIMYLHERDIISDKWLQANDIDQEKVFSKKATKKEFQNLIAALETDLNGMIFPISKDKWKEISPEMVTYVASIFKGDETSGQLALDFKVYDFSFIPIEFISLVYEQFLHNQGQAKSDGAYYTPEPIADYLLSEINSAQTISRGIRILDPSCGSGIFLVLAFRKLIELELKNSNTKKLRPVELRKILTECIFGIERNQDACYVTEFSLILTLLSYLEPSDLHTNKNFKFPSLHNSNIICKDTFDPEIFQFIKADSFDWVVGNPPWEENIKEGEEKEKHILAWLGENKDNFPVAGKKTSEAFLWRVRDFVKKSGITGLHFQASSLVNIDSLAFRKKFFECNAVYRITNFSNFAHILYAGRASPRGATIVYKKEATLSSDIVHVSPFVANQIWLKEKRGFWTFTLKSSEIQSISQSLAKKGDAITWKIALWGTYKDKQALNTISKMFSNTLANFSLLNERSIHQSIQLRSISETNRIENAEERIKKLNGLKKILDLKKYKAIKGKQVNKNNSRLSFPEAAFEKITDDNCFIRQRGGVGPLKSKNPSTLLLNSNYYPFHNDFIVTPGGQNVLSGKKEDENTFRALSVFLNSSINFYTSFFLNPQMGVDRTHVNLKPLKKAPIPDFTKQQILELSDIHRKLAIKEQESFFNQENDIVDEIDKSLSKVLKIPDDLMNLVREFRKIRYSLNEGKVDGKALSKPSLDHLRIYAKSLRKELDEFISEQSIYHEITIHKSDSLIVCEIHFRKSKTSFEPIIKVVDSKVATIFKEIESYIKEKFSQWFYVKKTLKIPGKNTIYLCKTSHLIDWTATQAMLDGDEIIADMISGGNLEHVK